MAEVTILWNSPASTFRVTLADAVNVKAGDVVTFNSSSNLQLADANAAAGTGMWFVLEHRRENDDPNVATVTVCRECIAYDADAPYTADGLVFISATAGAITQTNPGAAAAGVRCVGYAISTSLLYLSAYIKHIYMHANIAGLAAATATNYGRIGIATEHMQFIGGWEVHQVAGSDGGAVTLVPEKANTGEDDAGGDVMSASTWNLKGTANTPAWLAPHTTVANNKLIPGDFVILQDAGTLTAVDDVCVTLIFVERLVSG